MTLFLSLHYPITVVQNFSQLLLLLILTRTLFAILQHFSEVKFVLTSFILAFDTQTYHLEHFAIIQPLVGEIPSQLRFHLIYSFYLFLSFEFVFFTLVLDIFFGSFE